MREFTTKVISGGLLNIPSIVEEMEDFQQGDLLTLRVIKQKRNGEVIAEHNEDN